VQYGRGSEVSEGNKLYCICTVVEGNPFAGSRSALLGSTVTSKKGFPLLQSGGDMLQRYVASR
jgi:hypothetical protein